jgi:ATP-dependent DNA helicase RecQ
MSTSVDDRFPTRTAAVNIQTLMQGQARLPIVLQSMGYKELRPGQLEPIIDILGQRDCLLILPTATGKTACFVIPTLALQWHTLAFSPLVALMRDQVKGLRAKGIAANCMSGMQSDAENAQALQQWMRGELSMLYVAPERLGNPQFKEAIRTRQPDMVVLDEAHTLSQWSDNFRPSYMALGDFVREYNPKVVMACTATAPPEVEKDIRRVLSLGEAQKHIHYPRRKNLKLTSRDFVDMLEMVNVIRNIQGSVIVYCGRIEKGVEPVAAQLSSFMPDTEITIFHGKLPDATKRTNQDLFMEGHCKVVVATNAFGMGIDKEDVRGVIHYDFPGSVEYLAQEVGRAGRDGIDSLCLTYRRPEALSLQRFFIDNAFPPREQVEAVFDQLCRSANKENIATITLDVLGKNSGISPFRIDSVMSILTGNNVIDRIKATEKMAKMRFVGNSEDKKFQQWKGIIEKGGEQDSEGFWKFDLNWLVKQLGVSYTTVATRLREWDKLDLARYVSPPRSQPIRIIGRIENVDFDRLHKKMLDANNKLNEVLRYFTIPDADKHRFIEDHFHIHQ